VRKDSIERDRLSAINASRRNAADGAEEERGKGNARGKKTRDEGDASGFSREDRQEPAMDRKMDLVLRFLNGGVDDRPYNLRLV